jgi:hypothetical protein
MSIRARPMTESVWTETLGFENTLIGKGNTSNACAGSRRMIGGRSKMFGVNSTCTKLMSQDRLPGRGRPGVSLVPSASDFHLPGCLWILTLAVKTKLNWERVGWSVCFSQNREKWPMTETIIVWLCGAGFCGGLILNVACNLNVLGCP